MELFLAKAVATRAEWTAVFSRNPANPMPPAKLTWHTQIKRIPRTSSINCSTYDDIDTSTAQWEAVDPRKDSNAMWHANAVNSVNQLSADSST